MEEDIEVNTDALNADTLLDYTDKTNSCNAFSFWYVENVNENAVVKDSEFFGRDHCYVYDPDLDVTIDATCSQFRNEERAPDAWDDMPFAGAWDGETHPYEHETDIVDEWTSREAFEEHYSQHPNAPYIF